MIRITGTAQVVINHIPHPHSRLIAICFLVLEIVKMDERIGFILNTTMLGNGLLGVPCMVD